MLPQTDVQPVADHIAVRPRQATELRVVAPDDSLLEEERARVTAWWNSLSPEEQQLYRAQQWLRQQQLQAVPSNQNGSRAASNRSIR